jgi:hypothetical protein
MKKMTNAGNGVNERDVYSPPCVVAIGDLNRGTGQSACDPTGSGDSVMCDIGNSAGNYCETGNNAAQLCDTGNNGLV